MLAVVRFTNSIVNDFLVVRVYFLRVSRGTRRGGRPHSGRLPFEPRLARRRRPAWPHLRPQVFDAAMFSFTITRTLGTPESLAAGP